MSQHNTRSGHYTSLPDIHEQPQDEDEGEDEALIIQDEEDDTLQGFLQHPPPHADSMFRHLASNLATPSQNVASTSNTTLTNHPLNPTPLTNPITNPIINLVINLAVNPVGNPAPNSLAIPPAPASMDLVIWANNQALILSLIPTLWTITAQNQPPPVPPKEGDAQAPVKFSGDENSKLRDFLFKCGLVFDAKPCTYATDRACVIYAIQHLTSTAKRHFQQDIEQGYQTLQVTTWAAFVHKLETIFSDPDCVKQVTEKLITLWMNENQHVHQYTVAFKEYADELGWSDRVLHPLYYRGLLDRIKDLWAQTNLPVLFADLVAQAQ